MNLSKELKKAMIDSGMKGAKQLSEVAGISYGKTIRALNGDSSSRLIDIAQLAHALNLEIKFSVKGE
jgi:DNA-binding phage protein